MNPVTRKVLITLLVFGVVGAVFASVVFGKKGRQPAIAPTTSAPAAQDAQPMKAADQASSQPPIELGPAAPTAPAAAAALAPVAPQVGAIKAVPAGDAPRAIPSPLGSLDPTKARFQIEFAPNGAGINRILFSDYWNSAAAQRQAQRHAKNDNAPAPLEADRHALRAYGVIGTTPVPMLAMHSAEVDGQRVSLFGSVWSERLPGVFATRVERDGTAIVEITRTFRLGDQGGGYELIETVEFRSLAGDHEVQLVSYGPGDLTLETGAFIDARRFQLGYLMSAERDPTGTSVLYHDGTIERSSAISKIDDGEIQFWPTPTGEQEGLRLSWFGSTSRYFALGVLAPYAPPGADSREIGAGVHAIRGQLGVDAGGEQVVFTELHTAPQRVAGGQTLTIIRGIYAGPLEPKVLNGAPPLGALGVGGLIRYSLGGMCACCTFAWLADLLVNFLVLLHDYVVFDWGLAIVVLVIVVRLLLHPLTKMSQVQMAKFAKSMGQLKPEMEALQRRYADDKAKLQQETMRLYKEKGVSPFGCVGGMAPTFLQMPIWMALYAVLYLAFELRQQAAFFGVFQQIGDWSFLGDLSAQDNFIILPTPIDLWFATLRSINIIPLGMGVVFWLQQKYMSPPQVGPQTPEQESQQKMMKVMMTGMFPLMLYAAPSGLTLYILTSTLIGMLESKRIRAGIEAAGDKPVKKSAVRDRLGKMYAAALERAQERAKRGQKPRTFKGRD